MNKNVINPNNSDALEFININHTNKPDKTMLILAGDCIIEYKGRARSFLDWGERVIMIKQDGTLLVHQPEMREPINWQPTGSKTEFKIKEDKLILKSYIKRPPEKMKIKFRDIKFITTVSLKDNAKLKITGMEQDYVNQIINNPSLIEEGLRVVKREKPVKSGMIDLFCYDNEHTPVIIEVKRSLANISSVHQLRMYVKDVKKDVTQFGV